MSRPAVVICVALVAVAFGVGAVVVFDAVYTRPAVGRGSPGPVMFAVQGGESFSSIATRLAEFGLVRNPRALEVYAWLRGWDRKVKAGTYQFTRGERARDLLGKLVLGDVMRVSVTIPEGFTLSQIARALAVAANVDSVAFGKLLTDPQVMDGLGVKAPSLEGYLFPDTYLIPWGMTPSEIVGMMRARLEEVFDEDMKHRVDKIGMTRHELLTLASIVQAETRRPDEFALVSAVYHNRLRNGMKLEADPTVAYAMGGYRSRLYFKDLGTDSPYNTYVHGGLPPGPICAPGKAAILAALYPDSTCKALYFVARGDGAHVFSTTLKDHLAAVEAMRRARRGSE